MPLCMNNKKYVNQKLKIDQKLLFVTDYYVSRFLKMFN